MAKNIFDVILKRVQANNYIGYNPYDILASEWINKNIKNKKLLLSLTQFNKISPINFRPVLRIKKNHNPKATALIMSALIRTDFKKHRTVIESLKTMLLVGKSSEYNEYSIGFSFPIVLSSYTSKINHPSLIITLFVAYAFFEYYEKTKDQEILKQLLSIKNLIETQLYFEETENELWFSYNFEKQNEIFNSTAKIGKFYTLLYKITKEKILINKIIKITNYTISHQRFDGSWPFAPKYDYSDSFHTAFILEALYIMQPIIKSKNIDKALEKGFDNYKNNFIKSDFQPLYIHPKYPNKGLRNLLAVTKTDIRDCSMAIILFSKMGQKEMAKNIFKWTNSNMYQNKGYYSFYNEKYWPNKIEYIRPQGWMLYAMSYL